MARNYFQTKAGMLNFILLLFNIVNFVCIVSVVNRSAGFAFMVAAILGFFITAAFSLANVFGLTEKLSWPWPYMEVIYTRLWTLYYLIAAIFLFWINVIQYVIAGIFGLFTAVAYVIKSYHIYMTEIDDNAEIMYVKQ